MGKRLENQSERKKILFNVVSFIFLVFLFILADRGPDPIHAQHSDTPFVLSHEEKEYIRNQERLKVATLDNVAPLAYMDSEGMPKGIFISVMDYIEELTGLDFELSFYPSVSDIFENQTDLVLGISSAYNSPNLLLTEPFLEAETVLFMRKNLDPNKLANKKFASIEGEDLLDSIKKEHTVLFDSRRDSLEGVEKGEADYGYGNEYSVTFYTIQNSYKNIITVPKGKNMRNYAIGLSNEDPMLLSILNKSIKHIDDKKREHFILEMATSIEREITIIDVIQKYWYLVLGTTLLIIGLLFGIIYTNNKKSKIIVEQNKKLKEKSKIDGLTGLYNLTTMREKIENRMKNKDSSEQDAIAVIDCDNFKGINDYYGHLAGNHALEHVSEILKETFPKDAFVGRIGGDEFLVYMKDIHSIEQIEGTFKKVIDLAGAIEEEFKIPLSIGIKRIANRETFDQLLNAADKAMYEAKEKGGKQLILK